MKGRAFLDTNVALFAAGQDQRLTPKVRKMIESHSRIAVSSVSMFELEMKAMIGKLNVVPDFAAQMVAVGLEIESFDTKAAVQIRRFGSLIGHDPFDRMILAQAASVPNTTFYTFDETLAALGFDWIVHISK